MTETDTSLLNEAQEAKARARLAQHFSESYQDRTDGYVEMVLDLGNYTDRFHYLLSVLGKDFPSPEVTVLVSGCGAGSEMYLARQFGFGDVHGVEVEPIWVQACSDRLSHIPGMHAVLYDGDYLPYADQQFDLLLSGHVIEHTADPQLYMQECMRVLAPGGYLLLEFPHRYHRRELHTGLPSLEWLPRPLRNAAIGLISSRLSPLNGEAKSRYLSIVSTNIQQISIGGIRRMLKRARYPHTIRILEEVVPGIIRGIVQKG